MLKPLTNFERFILSQPVPSLSLPAMQEDDEVGLWDRADILLYGSYVPRGEENLRVLAIAVGILPGSAEEIAELEHAGY